MTVIAKGAVSAEWSSVLETLGCPVPHLALPTCTRCPQCAANLLQVHEDRICGGVWFRCLDCPFAGDLLDLAAATWQCSRELAVRKLTDLGVLVQDGSSRSRTAREARTIFDRVRKTFAFAPTEKSVSYRTLLARLKVPPHLTPEVWREGPGQMLLACHRRQLDAALAPGLVDERSVLKGKGWRELIVAPFEDLPGRTCGLLCTGRQAGPTDTSYISVRPFTKSGVSEAGLAGLWSLAASRRVLGEHVIAVSSPFFAARFHARVANFRDPPLPVIAYHDGGRFRTQNAWQCLDRTVPVLWGPRLDAGTLYQAERCNGMISVMRIQNVSADSIDHYLRQAEPMALVRKAIRFARPWREALVAWADEADDVEVEELLLAMESYPGPLSRLGLSPRLREMLARRRRPTRLWLNDHMAIVEREGRWYGQRRGRTKQTEALIMNAVLRVDRLGMSDGSPQYECRLIHENDEIPVKLTIGQSQRHAALLTKALAMAKQAALHVEPGWSSYLVSAAMRFEPLAE